MSLLTCKVYLPGAGLRQCIGLGSAGCGKCPWIPISTGWLLVVCATSELFPDLFLTLSVGFCHRHMARWPGDS